MDGVFGEPSMGEPQLPHAKLAEQPHDAYTEHLLQPFVAVVRSAGNGCAQYISGAATNNATRQ